MAKRQLVGYSKKTELVEFELDIAGVARGEGCVLLTHENAEEIAGRELSRDLDYFLEDYQ